MSDRPRLQAFLDKIAAGDEVALENAKLVSKAYFQYLLKSKNSIFGFSGKNLSLLAWKLPAKTLDSQINASVAANYANYVGSPFNAPKHAINAYSKMYRVLQDLCHSDPPNGLVWACWVSVVAQRQLANRLRSEETG